MQILKAEPGEFVTMHDGVYGVIKINFENCKYADEFGPGGWDDEEGGILLDGSSEGLIRYSRDVIIANQEFYKNNPSS